MLLCSLSFIMIVCVQEQEFPVFFVMYTCVVISKPICRCLRCLFLRFLWSQNKYIVIPVVLNKIYTSLSVSLSLSIYIYMSICNYVYICIYFTTSVIYYTYMYMYIFIEFWLQAKPSILYVGFVFLAASSDDDNNHDRRIDNHNLIIGGFIMILFGRP